MSYHEISEMLEAYALGALDDQEQATVEAHLQDCADCQRLLHEYAEVVHAIPQAMAVASPLQPPAALKTRLLQSLETAPPVAPSPAVSVAEKPTASLPRPKAWWWRPRTAVALAAAIVLILSLVWSVRLSVALARERALRAEFANLVDQQEVVLEVIDSDKTSRLVLRSADSNSNAYGKLFTRSDLPHVVAMAARLPQPAPGQAYHLWVSRNGQTRLAGVMKVNDQGFGLLVFDADSDGPVYNTVQLTLQAEGSKTPSGSPVILWPVSKE